MLETNQLGEADEVMDLGGETLTPLLLTNIANYILPPPFIENMYFLIQ